MNSNVLLFSCCLCQRNISAAAVVQFPCCNPSPHFCYECVSGNPQGTHCQVCGDLWSLPEILALFKQNKVRQQHTRNRSEIMSNKINNKLNKQSGYNRSYEPNPHIQNIPNGGAFVNDDFLELIKREIREGQQEKKSFFKDPFALPTKQNFFSQNFSNNGPLNGSSFGSTRPSTYQDEINEFYSQNYSNPNRQFMLNSVVTRDFPNFTPYNTNSNPFPNANFQNMRTNEDFNNHNLNFLASAPEKINNSGGYYDNPLQRNFTNFNSVQFPPESMVKAQYQDSFDPKINMRFNDNMKEAEFLQKIPENINKNSDAMAIEPESIPDMGFLNINPGQNEDQSQNQPQLIHINNVNIQNAALNSQFTYVPPQSFAFQSPSHQNSNVPKNFFNQNVHDTNNEKMRNSHIFGVSSPFPDNRNDMRRSVSPIRNSRKSFEVTQSQFTPKNSQKAQKINENWQRFDNMETNRKFNEDFKMRAGLFDNSQG